ncbi:Mitogen-activated protein kinase kinase kinase 5 [Geodia barretti]|nr:Mitogen-activated protein kinase kinase kinase 5 [Geodia barretti]
MLQAQNRMVLIAVLSDQKEKICEEVLTKLKESRPPRVDKGQLLVVISALALFARSDSDTGLEDILGQLKRDCFHDHHLRDDVELSCKTLIPAAVTMANKRHGTAPHAMFAIDEIVLCGVRSILVIVSPESVQSILEKIPPTPTKSPSHTSLTVTTPVTTPTSSVDARDVQRQLRTALEENLQLLKDMNDVMRTYVLEVKGQMPRPAARKKVTFQTDSVEDVDSGVATGDSNLVAWLEDIQLDHASIQRFVAEQLTLSDVRDHMTREDVVDLKLKIGPRCRVWAAISEYRSSKLNTT